MPIKNIHKYDVVVQWNATWYIINRLLIQCFAKVNNQDIILFSVQYSSIKKDGGKIVDDTDLFTMQDDNGTYISLNLLNYCKKMPACLLTNLSIQFGIVNEVQTTVYRVILNLRGN